MDWSVRGYVSRRSASGRASGLPSERETIAIILPVYNDWDSFALVVRELDAVLARDRRAFEIFVIDDGSDRAGNDALTPALRGLATSVTIVRLICNLGHQRAIAVGLSLVEEREHHAVIVMDADGEDRPADIPSLLALHQSHPGAIVVARRARRSEGATFKVGYLFYKAIFRALTGKTIDFGNFCLIPRDRMRRLIGMSELWNHLAATVVRSKVQLVRLSTTRGGRYAGQSQMNLVSLAQHGIGAMSVFSDVLFVRLTFGAVAMFGFAAIMTSIAVGVRLFTNWAIPGWTTLVVGLAGIVVLQVLSSLLIATMMAASNRSAFSFVPKQHTRSFIDSITTIDNR
jgi:glycosyltransferase involved in cell wall biosynthesis